MEFLVTLTDADLIVLKQKLIEQNIEFEIKMLSYRITEGRVWIRSAKNSYTILVKNKIETAKKIIRQS